MVRARRARRGRRALEAAVVREVAEETGLDVVVDEFLGWVERFDDDAHYVILDFRVTVLDPDTHCAAGDDAAEAAWVPITDLGDYTIVDGLSTSCGTTRCSTEPRRGRHVGSPRPAGMTGRRRSGRRRAGDAGSDPGRLDDIEEHVVQMSKFGAQILYAPMGRAGHRPTDPGHVPDEGVQLARAGKRRDAIVKSRELTGADPNDAAAVVDGLSVPRDRGDRGVEAPEWPRAPDGWSSVGDEQAGAHIAAHERDRVGDRWDRHPGAGVVGFVAPLAGPHADGGEAGRAGAGDVLGGPVADVHGVGWVDAEVAQRDAGRGAGPVCGARGRARR